jgi:hypothetical protein
MRPHPLWLYRPRRLLRHRNRRAQHDPTDRKLPHAASKRFAATAYSGISAV